MPSIPPWPGLAYDDAMGDEISLVAWARNERHAILRELEVYARGARIEQTRQGGIWADSTPQVIAQLKGRAAHLAKFIAQHDGPTD
jgi:predicted transcriptional regulator